MLVAVMMLRAVVSDLERFRRFHVVEGSVFLVSQTVR